MVAAIDTLSAIVSYAAGRSPSMTDAGQRASFLDQQCNAAVMHLRSAEMSYGDASKIIELVSSSTSPFTPEQRDRICSVTDELLLRNSGASEASGSKST